MKSRSLFAWACLIAFACLVSSWLYMNRFVYSNQNLARVNRFTDTREMFCVLDGTWSAELEYCGSAMQPESKSTLPAVQEFGDVRLSFADAINELNERRAKEAGKPGLKPWELFYSEKPNKGQPGSE